jgi:hypothetical protein
MRVLVFIGLGFIVTGCSSGSDHFNRGYVISKSQVDSDKEAPQPTEEETH